MTEKDKFLIPSWMKENLWDQCRLLTEHDSYQELYDSLDEFSVSSELYSLNEELFNFYHLKVDSNERPFPTLRSLQTWIGKGVPKARVQFINLLGFYILGKQWKKVDWNQLERIQSSKSKLELQEDIPSKELSIEERKWLLESKSKDDQHKERAFINEYFDNVDSRNYQNAWKVLTNKYKEKFRGFIGYQNGYQTTEKHKYPRKIELLEVEPNQKNSIYEIEVDVIDKFEGSLKNYQTYEDIPWIMILEYYTQKGENDRLMLDPDDQNKLIYDYSFGYKGPITRRYKKRITIEKIEGKLYIALIKTTEIAIILPDTNI